jgi:hypothetical protein
LDNGFQQVDRRNAILVEFKDVHIGHGEQVQIFHQPVDSENFHYKKAKNVSQGTKDAVYGWA